MKFDKDTKTLRLYHDLSFESVNSLWQEVSKMIDATQIESVDLAHVKHTDSAGLAFLLECLYRSGKAGGKLCFLNLPKKLMMLAKAHEVDELFHT